MIEQRILSSQGPVSAGRASPGARPRGRRNRLAAAALTVSIAGYFLVSVLRPQGGGAFLPLAVCALVFCALLVGLRRTVPLRRKPFAGRAEKPIGQFVHAAKPAGVSLRVAREAYDLLRHHYPRPMCVDLNDELRRDLRMSPAEVLSVRAALLVRTGRREDNEDLGRQITVRQLLEWVEAAPKSGVDRTTMRQRVTDLPSNRRPVVENLEFAEESALTDPDFLRRAHFKWVRRRDSDYKGFRSRESDKAPGKKYEGPFRRATELSRRLAIRQEAGRLVKEAAERVAAEERRGEAERPAPRDEQTPVDQAAYHGC